MLKTLLLLVALVWLARLVVRRVGTARAARSILEHGRTIYSGAHEFAEASLDQFPHLDADFYAETTRVLEEQGFRQLGDLQDMTVTRAGGVMMPAMLRVLVSADGAIVAGIYHARAKGAGVAQGAGSFHILDLESALSDGRFLTTSNAELAGRLEGPPEIMGAFLADATMPFMILDRHRARLASFLAANPGVTALVVATLEEALEHQARMDEIKARFRQAQEGVFTADELKRLAPDVAPGIADDVAQRMKGLDRK